MAGNMALAHSVDPVPVKCTPSGWWLGLFTVKGRESTHVTPSAGRIRDCMSAVDS